MTIGLKFGLVVLLLVSLTLGIAIGILAGNEAKVHLLQRQALSLQEEALVKEARARAGAVASFGEACRAYTQKVLAPAVEKHLGDKIVFEAQSRTFVARGTFEQLRQRRGMEDYVFREASLNPLNRKKNLADSEEQKLIERFRADRRLTELSDFVNKNGRDLYFVARPIVVEKSCLRCHGRPEDAPAEVTDRYGSESGFGWQVGDVNGILMILVPTDDLKENAALFRAESQQLADEHQATNRTMLLIFIGSALLLIVAVWGLFHLLVNRRIAIAAAVMRQVASNTTISARIADRSGDELGTLAQAFNHMADSLEAGHHQLEQRVQERTKELSEANAGLAAQTQQLQALNQQLQEQRRAALNLAQDAEKARRATETANADLQREIALRRQAEERLTQLAAGLARSNAELEQFAYIASHDLQEPLRKVQTFGDLLVGQPGAALDETGRLYVERMQGAARRMQGLINDLLTFSRVTSQAKPFVEVNLGEIAREVVSDLEARLRATGGRVEIGELPRLESDPTQMRQLLQNLVGNALKFHRPDVPPVVVVQGRIVKNEEGILLAPFPSGLVCEITVQDNGIGFDEKYLDRIFTPFQRLHGRGAYEGTGMGLAICRKIVERHGGTITARSAPGQGSTFVVTLPLRQMKGAPRA